MSGANMMLGEVSRQLDSLDTPTLDKNRRLITSIINERAWKVLNRLGHKYYRAVKMQVTFDTKNEVQLVHIEATYEQYRQEHAVVLDVPLKLFEGILKPETLTRESDG